MNAFLVFLGGGIGAVGRYWIGGIVHRFAGAGFPYGTMAANVGGCLVIGFLMSFFEERFLVSPALRVFLTIGVLGGFTTFSSFSYETIALLRDGGIASAFINIAVTLISCLTATWVGWVVGRQF